MVFFLLYVANTCIHHVFNNSVSLFPFHRWGNHSFWITCHTNCFTRMVFHFIGKHECRIFLPQFVKIQKSF